ncbi:MAG: hypothetical protein MUE60_12055 [Candidatus Eisenbacteria bacterium]|nr:hypothetical protein [Candidatus Eisenbacteria bacterium]
MVVPPDTDRIPRVPLVGFLVIVVLYLAASLYMAVFVFPREPVLDYGIGTTTRSILWAGPIGGLRDLTGLGAFFGVLGYILGSGILLWMIKGALFAERGWAKLGFAVGALAFWFLSGAALFGPGYMVF